MLKAKNKILITLLLSLGIFLGTSPNIYTLANKEMDKLSNTSSSNKYPIVMVHGLMGWGNTELFGLNYWGGFSSLKDHLTNEGYTVFTPTIGSITSNWDRACELYAYLKGGTVDYGEAHSKKYGHARYGRTYPGVYPEIGSKSNDGSIKKIHLIGHSMGGQTARLITQLLEKGSTDELSTPQNNLSELFSGGKSWISSVTTLSTPHDGSPTARETSTFLPNVQQFVARLGSQVGVINSDNPCFDYRLDQWGLHKKTNESFKDYKERVSNSSLWNKTKDFSLWELTPEGSKELNSWVSAQDDVYYFSLSCQDTHKDSLTNHQVPDINMNPLFIPSSQYIGSCISNNPGEVQITNNWWANDGLVSVLSAEGPHEGSKDKITPYNGIPEKGTWNYLGTRQSTDHIDIVGLYKCDNKLKSEYSTLAKMLTSLPK
ncbi:lipase [Clostridium sp. HBUAS56017]|uniref:esterase/lipase family protein n=1 Tax=Clostridium sp. HBUAS56017 TaxID=2571128 RepID=UPI001177B2FA|nr:lipase [Clostridium sp. HBUAS56017]